MLDKLFHREAYVAATATYTSLYRETCYAYLNAANQLNLAYRPHNDASEIYIKPAITRESSEACREASGRVQASCRETSKQRWD
jgi:hypothetical protein